MSLQEQELVSLSETKMAVLQSDEGSQFLVSVPDILAMVYGTNNLFLFFEK